MKSAIVKTVLVTLSLFLFSSLTKAQVSTPKLQWKRTNSGIAYDREKAIKGYRDPSTGSIYVLYQGEYNYGVVQFDNSGASVASYRNKAPSGGYSFGGDFKYVGNSEIISCGEQNGQPFINKFNLLGDSLWTYKESSNYNSSVFYSSSLSSLSILPNTDIIAGGDKADTSYLVKLNANGQVVWTKSYQPVGYTIGRVLGLKGDNFNNVYACGTVKNISGNYDGFVTAFDNNGNVLWEKLINGTANANDSITKIVMDNSGNVYVGGIIKNNNTIDNSTFVAKYNASGSLIYFKTFHQMGQYSSSFGGFNIDVAGNVVFATNVFMTPSTSTIYTQKISANGTTLWTNNYNHSTYDFPKVKDVSFDNLGNVFLSGDASLYGQSASSDEFVVKINTLGTFVWERQYDNPSQIADNNVGLIMDNSNNSYLIGHTGFQLSAQVSDVTVIKYNSSGILQWEGNFNSEGNLYDNANKLILDGSHALYTLKTIENTGTNTDVVLSKYNTLGNLLWQVNYDNAQNYDYATSMVMDAQKNLYVLAFSANTSIVLKYDSLGGQIWERQYNELYASICIDNNANVYLAGGKNFNSFSYSEFFARKVDSNGNTIYNYIPSVGNKSIEGAFSRVNASGELVVWGFAEQSGPSRGYLRLAKFAANGTLAWSFNFNGPDSSNAFNVYPTDLEIDLDGNIIVVARARGVISTTMDGFVAKVSPTGNVLWVNHTAIGFDVEPKDLDIDSRNNIFVLNSSSAIFKYDPNTGANLLYTHVGSPYNNIASLIKVYKQNELLIAGTKGYQSFSLIKTDTLGMLISQQEYYNQNNVGVDAKDMVFDSAGRIYVLANSTETEGPIADVLTLKYCDLPIPEVVTVGQINNFCPGSNAILTAPAAASYLWQPSLSTQQSYTTNTTESIFCQVFELDGCYQHSDTINVVKRDAPLTPQICLVTVDSLSTHNIIIWDKTGITGVSAFNIFREDVTNIYSYIGSVSYDSLSEYHDFAANPNVTTKRYKMSAIDSCGQESLLANYHNTLYIVYNGLGQFSWNPLYTIENSSNPVNNYLLMRDDNSTGVWTQIASTAGTQNTIVDPSYASFPNASYRVQAAWNIICEPTRGPVNTTRSNIRTPTSIGINELSNQNSFAITPNPANESVTITVDSREENMKIEIYNTLGQKVIEQKLENAETQILISELQAGTYFVKVIGKQNQSIKKLIKYG